MWMKDEHFSKERQGHPMHKIRLEYIQLINDSMDELDNLIKSHWQLSIEHKLEVISYLSTVKYRFSFWDFLIDEMSAQVYVEGVYGKDNLFSGMGDKSSKDSILIEGPISAIYYDRSIFNLNYFLNKGANPFESRSWGTVAFDIWGDGYFVVIDDVYLEILEDATKDKNPPKIFNREIFDYNLSEEQHFFVKYIEENFYRSFQKKFNAFFQQYNMLDLEQLSQSYSKHDLSQKNFLACFIKWNETSFLHFGDNFFELFFDIKYSTKDFRSSLFHYLRRNDFVKFSDIIDSFHMHGKSNKKLSAAEKKEFKEFYSELHYLVFLAKLDNKYLTELFTFYDRIEFSDNGEFKLNYGVLKES